MGLEPLESQAGERRARNEGIVWEQIAASLGVSKQAVHRKYASGSRFARGKKAS